MAMMQHKEPTVIAQTRQYSVYRIGSLTRLYRLVAEAVLCLAGPLVAAQRRARRRLHLAELDDAALKDVGLSRAAATRELHKPSWRR